MTLPLPDPFGNYWLGDAKFGPAIFPLKALQDGPGELRTVVWAGAYTALVSPAYGFVKDKNGRRQFFQTPAAALKALNEILRLTGR